MRNMAITGSSYLGPGDETTRRTRGTPPALCPWFSLKKIMQDKWLQQLTHKLSFLIMPNHVCPSRPMDRVEKQKICYNYSIAPHLWSWGSSNARWTSQAPYSSLALVALKDHIGNTVTTLDSCDFTYYIQVSKVPVQDTQKSEQEMSLLYLFTLDANSRCPLGPPETYRAWLTLKTQSFTFHYFQGFDIGGHEHM